MAFLPNMEKKIHVLLVEHDIKDLDKTMNMLHYFSYEVTQVNLASAALSILSKATINVDLVMANMNSPDSCGFQLLLHEAIQRDLLVILMSNDDDPVTTMRALQQGAFLRIKKPVTMQIAGYLWQHVFREKVRKQFREVMDCNNIQDFGDQACHIEGNQNTNNNDGERQKSKKKLNSGSTSQNDNEFKKKVWIEWTEELHYKFVAAVVQLGEGRCYPKEILELMNEPGLTRMQVASHLQKCRNAKWLPPGERKSKPANTESTAPKNKVRRSKNERFGSMPLIDNNFPLFNLRSQNYHHDQSTIDPSVQTNVHANCGEGYYPQVVLGDHGSNYPFTHAKEIFNMGHLGQTPTDVTEDTTYEDENMDSMVQIFSAALQQDLEMDYNLNQTMTTATNTSSEWSQEEQESVNDEETKG